MSEEALQKAYEVMTSRIGEQTSRSEWFEVTQERINDFAEVTMDHQWIHIDVEKLKEKIKVLKEMFALVSLFYSTL